MNGYCVYRAMDEIKNECRYLTQWGRRAYEQGAVAEVNASLVRAFDLSKRLLDLPIVLPGSVHCFVRACFNCIEYCDGEDGSFRRRQLQAAATALHDVVAVKSHCIMVRRVALDCYIVVHRALVRELMWLNRDTEVERVSSTFRCAWRDFSAELIPMH